MLKSLISGSTLDNVEPAAADIITRAVESHNRAALPEGELERGGFFSVRNGRPLQTWHSRFEVLPFSSDI